MEDVHHQRACDADGVDPAVAIEVGVFGGEEGEPDVRWDVGERHQVATFDEELADERAVLGVDAGRHRRLVAQELIDGRKLGGDLAVEDHADERGGESARDGRPEEDSAEPAGRSAFPRHGAARHVTRSSEVGQKAKPASGWRIARLRRASGG